MCLVFHLGHRRSDIVSCSYSGRLPGKGCTTAAKLPRFWACLPGRGQTSPSTHPRSQVKAITTPRIQATSHHYEVITPHNCLSSAFSERNSPLTPHFSKPSCLDIFERTSVALQPSSSSLQKHFKLPQQSSPDYSKFPFLTLE